MRARMAYPPIRTRGLRAGSLERSFARFMMLSCVEGFLSVIASGDRQCLARDPRGIRRSKEDGGGGDVLRLTNAAERRLCLNLLAHVALGDARGVDAFRL